MCGVVQCLRRWIKRLRRWLDCLRALSSVPDSKADVRRCDSVGTQGIIIDGPLNHEWHVLSLWVHWSHGSPIVELYVMRQWVEDIQSISTDCWTVRDMMRQWVDDIHTGCTDCWTLRDWTLGNCLQVLVLLLALSVLCLHSESNVWPGQWVWDLYGLCWPLNVMWPRLNSEKRARGTGVLKRGRIIWSVEWNSYINGHVFVTHRTVARCQPMSREPISNLQVFRECYKNRAYCINNLQNYITSLKGKLECARDHITTIPIASGAVLQK